MGWKYATVLLRVVPARVLDQTVLHRIEYEEVGSTQMPGASVIGMGDDFIPVHTAPLL